MPVVTFNENVDHHVKGDVVKLSADELKAIDDYATLHEIDKPYTKGEHEVTNTTDTPNITDVAREDSLKRAPKGKNANDKTDEPAVDDAITNETANTAGVESEADLVENANKQAVGETLPEQEGDNPSDVDLEQAADDAQEAEAEEQAATDGEGSADVAAAQDGDAKNETTTVDASGTDEATELRHDGTPAEGTPEVEAEPNTEGSGDVTPPAKQASKARNSNKK